MRTLRILTMTALGAGLFSSAHTVRAEGALTQVQGYVADARVDQSASALTIAEAKRGYQLEELFLRDRLLGALRKQNRAHLSLLATQYQHSIDEMQNDQAKYAEALEALKAGEDILKTDPDKTLGVPKVASLAELRSRSTLVVRQLNSLRNRAATVERALATANYREMDALIASVEKTNLALAREVEDRVVVASASQSASLQRATAQNARSLLRKLRPVGLVAGWFLIKGTMTAYASMYNDVSGEVKLYQEASGKFEGSYIEESDVAAGR